MNVERSPELEAGDLHRISINSVLFAAYTDMQNEFSMRIRTGSTHFRNLSYSAMASMESMALTQAKGHSDLLRKYIERRKELDEAYGDPSRHQWELYPEEADKRKELIEGILYDLGSIRVDERPEAISRPVYNFNYAIDGREIIHDHFAERLAENRNMVVVFDGKPGGGKSWASLAIGDYESKRSFDLSSLVYDIDAFIGEIEKRQPGDVIILDEAGISAGSRDAMTRESKVLGKVLQSIRYLKYLTIFTVPNALFLDKQIRLLCDLVLTHEETMRQGEFIPKIPTFTPDGKDVEFTALKRGNDVIKTMFFPHPRPALIADYENMRKTHNLKQLSDLHKSIKKDEPADTVTDGRGKNANSLANLRHFKKEGDINE